MASREEKKAARRAERERAEREEAARAKRARLAQLGGGGLLAAALVAGVVILALSGAGDSQTAEPEGPSGEEAAAVPLPPRREEDLQAAAEAAGCQIRETESQGAEHVTDTRDTA